MGGRMSEGDRDTLVFYLRAIPVFSRLSDEDLQAIAARCSTQQAPAGRVLFRAGEQGRSLYVIASGQVELLDQHGNLLTVLRSGSFVGEHSVLAETPYPVTARVSEDATLWVLDREGLEAVMVERPKVALAVTRALVRRSHTQPTPTVLNQVPLFEGLSTENLAEIAQLLRVVSYSANAVVCRRGDPAKVVYIVAEGEVSVRESDENSPELYRARPFESLGVAEALAGEAYNHAVVAVGPTTCWALPAETLEGLVDRFPRLGVNLNRVVVAELSVEERTAGQAAPEFQAPVPARRAAKRERTGVRAWWHGLGRGLRWRLAILAALLVWLAAVAIPWTVGESIRQGQMYANLDPSAWGKTIVGNSPAGVSLASDVQLAYPTPTPTPPPTPTPMP